MSSDYRALCEELIDALESNHQTWRIPVSPLIARARAALAAEPVAERPTDEELLATLDNATADFPPRHPEAEALNAVEYPLALELRKARAVLARYGHQPAPPAAGEQRHPTPVPVAERLPSASHVYFEFVISDADSCTQAGGIAPTYAQALSEGQHYLAQYQQDGPHTLELRRVEVLPPGALPVPQGEVQP